MGGLAEGLVHGFGYCSGHRKFGMKKKRKARRCPRLLSVHYARLACQRGASTLHEAKGTRGKLPHW